LARNSLAVAAGLGLTGAAVAEAAITGRVASYHVSASAPAGRRVRCRVAGRAWLRGLRVGG
jgi:hypothetical protein